MAPPQESRDLAAIAALGEPTRRRLYDAVASAAEPLTRDQAASRAGTTRALAAFHLDRLVDAGLLAAQFRRVSGRSGPGAGRPSKLYRRAEADVEVSLPPRRYDLAGELLAQALEAGRSKRNRAALAHAARAVGRDIGVTARARAASGGRRAIRSAALEALRERGFEPFTDARGDIGLRNCPFHALVGRHRDLVCGMNLDLMRGLRTGSGLQGYTPEWAPESGRCCVVFRHRGR